MSKTELQLGRLHCEGWTATVVAIAFIFLCCATGALLAALVWHFV